MTTALSDLTPDAAAYLARRTRHRIALRLLPFLFLLYIVNYVDRTNLSYAALGMSRDLGFSDGVFGLGAGVFFLSYLGLQIAGARLVASWSARRMISLCLIAWGSLTVLTAIVHTPGQLYAARFALGAAEAGFFPGMIVYLSHWFVPEDRAKATSNFMGAIPLSSVLGAPLAGWVLSRQWLEVTGWRWLFIMEGIPAVLLGIAAYFFLTDWPRDAKWLDAGQRDWIQRVLHQDEPVRGHTITIREAIGSRSIRLLSSLTFLAYLSLYSFVFWFPTILKRQSGYSDMKVGLLGAIPFLVTLIAMQANGWHSDRQKERCWHSAIPLFLSAAGCSILVFQTSSMPLAIALFTLVSLGTAYLPTFWAIPTETLDPAATATAVGFINSVGSIAGFAGPYAFGFLYSMTGSYTSGLSMMMMSGLASGLLLLRVSDTRDSLSIDPATLRESASESIP